MLKVLKVTAWRQFKSAAFWKPVKTGIEKSVKRRATWTERNTIITLHNFFVSLVPPQFSMSTIKSLLPYVAPYNSIGFGCRRLSPAQ